MGSAGGCERGWWEGQKDAQAGAGHVQGGTNGRAGGGGDRAGNSAWAPMKPTLCAGVVEAALDSCTPLTSCSVKVCA